MEYPLFSGILPGAGERAVKKTPKVPTLMEPRVGGGAEANKLNKETRKTPESDEGYERISDGERVTKGPLKCR